MYIHKIQLGIDEDLNENNDLSNELRDIMERARHLLCDIEFYVNATAGHKLDRPKILTIQEMSDILKFPKRSTETQADQIRVHSKFVKKRFESYINILLKRLQRPGSLKVETKSGGGGKKRKCAGKMGAKDQNALRKPNCVRRKLRKNNVELISSEPKTTPKMHHVNRKKNNSINQKFVQQSVDGGAQQNKQIVQIKIRGVNKSINDINNQISPFNPQMKRRKLKLERLRANQERNFPRHRKNDNNIPVTTTTQSPLLN